MELILKPNIREIGKSKHFSFTIPKPYAEELNLDPKKFYRVFIQENGNKYKTFQEEDSNVLSN